MNTIFETKNVFKYIPPLSYLREQYDNYKILDTKKQILRTSYLVGECLSLPWVQWLNAFWVLKTKSPKDILEIVNMFTEFRDHNKIWSLSRVYNFCVAVQKNLSKLYPLLINVRYKNKIGVIIEEQNETILNIKTLAFKIHLIDLYFTHDIPDEFKEEKLELIKIRKSLMVDLILLLNKNIWGTIKEFSGYYDYKTYNLHNQEFQHDTKTLVWSILTYNLFLDQQRIKGPGFKNFFNNKTWKVKKYEGDIEKPQIKELKIKPKIIQGINNVTMARQNLYKEEWKSKWFIEKETFLKEIVIIKTKK
jgi:hypothetical protein